MPRDPEAERRLAGEIGALRFDPLGYVMYAFPWGVPGTPLAREQGPEEWQARHLAAVGEGVAGQSAADAADNGAGRAGAALGPLAAAAVAIAGIVVVMVLVRLSRAGDRADGENGGDGADGDRDFGHVEILCARSGADGPSEVPLGQINAPLR